MSDRGRHETGVGAPVGKDDLSLSPEFRSAIQVLTDGAPSNGIDLVPRWREIIASERERTEPGSQSSWRRRPSVPLLRYAALVAVGAIVGGGVVGAAARSGGDSGGIAVVGGVARPHYSASERSLMFALLDSESPTSETLTSASRDLARCVACHDGGLRTKLNAWRP